MRNYKKGQVVELYDGTLLKVSEDTNEESVYLFAEDMITKKAKVVFVADVIEKGASLATVTTMLVGGAIVLCCIIYFGFKYFI